MPVIFSKLKLVDNRSKTIIFGYIRIIEATLSLNLYEIPMDIKHLCVLYYFVPEQFDKHSNALKISSSSRNKENDIAEQINRSCWYCVFGTVIIDNIKNPYSIYKWIFKFTEGCKYGTSPSVGIVSHNNGLIEVDKYCFMMPCNHNFYAWETAWSTMRERKTDKIYPKKKYGSKIKSGDLITMEVNVKNKTLKYYKNNKDLGFAFQAINFNNYQYHMALSFASIGDKMEIINFYNETSQ